MSKRDIQNICYEMKPGEAIRFSGWVFNEAFPCGFPSIYNTPMEHFLSSMIGSAWGSFTIDRDFASGDYTIRRHEESDKRVYVDPDRAYMFNKMPSGELVLKEEYRGEV